MSIFGESGSERNVAKLEDVPLERSTHGDALHREFDDTPPQFTVGPDGLPVAIHNSGDLAPVFEPRTFVCMEDASMFVLRDRFGNVVFWADQSEVTTDARGRRLVPQSKVIGSIALTDSLLDAFFCAVPESVADAFVLNTRLRALGVKQRAEHGWVEVEPLRPACSHYYRYMVDLQNNPDRQLVDRICTAQRDENGFLLSVRDMRVHACELRQPRDPETHRLLEEFDARKLAEGKHRVSLETESFDIEEALRKAEGGA